MIHHIFASTHICPDGRILLPGFHCKVTPNDSFFDAGHLNIAKFTDIVCNKQSEYEAVQSNSRSADCQREPTEGTTNP